ncbi:MAG: oligosaccharide flippase family protein, partial [Stellaceae bacterium]
MSDTLARRVAKGALWLLAARWGVRLIGIASTILLARLLRPADYGLVGMATLLYSLVQAAGDFSLDMDLIRTGSRDHARYDTVWT